MYDLPYDGYEPRNLIKGGSVTSDIRAFIFERLDDGDDDGFVEGLPGFPGADRQAPRKGGGYGIDQIVNEAEAIISDAQEEANRVLAEARHQAQAEYDRLYAQALEQARAEVAGRPDPGLPQAAEELRAAGSALVEMTVQLQRAIGEQLLQMEQQLLETAFSIARKVIDRELETQPEIVMDSVREALGRLASGELTIRLNPADMPIVQRALLELQAERSVGDLLSFEEDPRVERGGCIVSGENGSVNTQPSSKLEQLRSLAGG